MGKPFTSEISNIAIAGVKVNAPPKKAIEKLNAARYNVVALTSVIKGNEGIISLLEEVKKVIREVASDGTKVKLGTCIQVLKLNNAQTVFPLKSCVRLTASTVHETRKTCFSFASSKVKAIEDLVIKNPILKEIFSNIGITQTDTALRDVS